jgi:hypothetical protein
MASIFIDLNQIPLRFWEVEAEETLLGLVGDSRSYLSCRVLEIRPTIRIRF